ncbi:MAG: glycerol-3-phosphate acyltransferase [Chloroflexota bacterium]
MVGKWSRGIDIRHHGSGNVGASNILSVSKWWSLPVIIFDAGKGMLPVYLARTLGLPDYQAVIIGLAAIIGHSWPVFLHFNGGRGILTAFGVVFALAPWLAVAMTILAFAGLPFGLFSLTALFVIVLLPILSWFASQPFRIEQSLALTLGLVALLLLAIIRRLTALRTSLTASVTTRELIINRLLFDRDIRDRKKWLNRNEEHVSDQPKQKSLNTSKNK